MTEIEEHSTPAPAHQPNSGFGPLWAGLGGAMVLSSLFASLETTLTGRESGDISMSAVLVGFLGTWAGMLIGIAWAGGLSFRGVVESLGLRFKWIDVPVGIVSGFFGQFVLVFLVFLPIRLIWPSTADRLGDPAEELTSVATGWVVIPFAICVCLIAPLVEELFFRGVVMRAVHHRWGSATLAIVVSGLVFGLVHFQFLQTPALVAFGFLLAGLAIRTGRLGPNIVAHVTFNTITVVVLLSQ